MYYSLQYRVSGKKHFVKFVKPCHIFIKLIIPKVKNGSFLRLVKMHQKLLIMMSSKYTLFFYGVAHVASTKV